MLIEDFINHVAGEPERTVTETVWKVPREILAKAAKHGGLRMTELLSAPERRAEHREIRYRHVLGPPASHEVIDAWEKQRPSHPLPADLRALVTRIDGIHLWANSESGRPYVGLAPVEEWELARIRMYGPAADRSLLEDRYVALSYHEDGASFVVLDVATGIYFLMDAAGPDAESP